MTTKTKRVLPTRGPGRPAGTDKNGAHTREHLLETARLLLAEKGIGQLSLREIADRAQVNPALLHYYFGSKEELRAALQHTSFEQVTARLSNVTDLDSAVRVLTEALFADHTLYRLVLHDEDFVKPIRDVLVRVLRGSGLDSELAVSSLLGIVTLTVSFELRAGKQRQKQVTEHCLAVCQAAFRSRS